MKIVTIINKTAQPTNIVPMTTQLMKREPTIPKIHQKITNNRLWIIKL